MLDEWSEEKREVLDLHGRNVKQTMSTIDYLEFVTTKYLDGNEQATIRDPILSVRDNIEGCATVLVDYRRARKEGRNRSVGGAEPT